MALGSRLTLVVTCLTLVPGPCRAQNDCFTSSSIVGAVLGTFFSTAVALALLVFLLWWIYYRQSPNRTGADRQSSNKGSRAVESGSGFDNPCFEANPNSDVVDGKVEEYGHKDVKSTSWTPLRFFGTSKNEKKRSMDDSFISEPERVSVQLRGHDFTGLGFNVTGNMRDGIFIKDILNRGPAFESGKIAPGDRILNVTISFRHVVYEDALTILSYASPYDVTMELEKGVRNSSSTLKKRKAASTVCLTASPSVTLSATTGSAQPEGPSNERLVHPLYRSQSIDDLSKVGRVDTVVRADMRLPSLTGQLSGGLAKSKLVGKANLEANLPSVPDVKMKGSKPTTPNVVLDVGDISVAPLDGAPLLETRPSKISKFAIKVLPDFKFKSNTKTTDLTPLPTGLDVPETELNLPKVEIHMPKASDLAIDIDVPDGSALPTRGDVSMAIDVPEQNYKLATSGNIGTDVKLDIETPSISVATPAVGSDLKIKEPKISLPSIDMPTANMEIDVPAMADVNVSQTIPNPDISVDVTKSAKSGFHIKFPKFGGNKSVKAEAPDVSLNVTAPEIDASLPDASLEIDPKLKKDGSKAGFEFKMPKLSMKKKPEVVVDAKAPELNLEVDANLPDTSLELPEISNVDVPSASVEIKKPKMSFSMPKFGMGKGQVEVKESANLALGAPSAQLDLSLSDDDENDEGKKKKKSIKMPKFSLSKPQAEINVAVPDVSAEMEIPSAQVDVGDIDIDKPDVKGKTKFGFKLPKIGGTATVPDANLDASLEHDVKLPNVDIKADVSSSSESDDDDEEGGKKKKRFNIKMPKFGLPKMEGDVNAPTVDVEAINVNVPDIKPVDANIGSLDVSADVLRMQSDSSEDSDSEDESKKKKGKKFFKIKAPEIDIGGDLTTPNLPLSPISVGDVNVAGITVDAKPPSLDLSAPVIGAELDIKKPKIVSPDIDINLPKAKLELDVKPLTLPDVTVGQDLPHPDVSLDVAKSSKSGFHIKFPKFGGNKSVKAEVPDVGLNVTAPEVDATMPDGSLEIDPKLKKDGSKAGFEFKMPKLSMKKKSEISVDAKVPTANVKVPEVDIDMKIPDASVEVKPLNTFAPELEIPSASIEVKKPKLGFSMPKFGMGKGQVEVKESINLAVDAPSVQVDLANPSGLSDDDEDGGKKKMKFGKMPKFGLNKPQINVAVPDVSAEMETPSAQVDVGDIDIDKPDVKGKAKFGFKLPKIGGTATVPDANLDASLEHDVKLPNVDIKADVSSSSESDDDDEEGGKKKKRFNIKMPKFGLPKMEGDVNAPNVDVEAINVNVPDIKPVEANLKLETPTLSTSIQKGSSQSDDSDSDDEKNRKVNLNIGGPSLNLDASIDSKHEEKKKGSKFGIKFPKLNVDKPRIKGEFDTHSESDSSDDDDDDKMKSSKIKVSAPSMDLSMPEASLQGNVEVPKTQFEVGVKQPKIDLEAAIDADDDNDDDESKKKSSKFGFSIKMPKFHMKKKTAHVDVDLDKDISAPSNLDVTSEETDEDRSSEDNHEKKRGKMSIKMPKFGLKKPEIEADLNVAKNFDVQTDVNVVKTEVDLPEFDLDVKDGDRDKSSFSLRLPEVTADKPKLDLDLDSSIEVEGLSKLNVEPVKVDLGKSPVNIGGKISVPDTSFGITVPQANIEVPEVELEVEHDDLDDEKKKSSKFFKMPKFHMGKHHGEFKVDQGVKVSLPEKVDADVSFQAAKLDLDPNLNVDLHGKDDADTDDDKKDKKKTRFGIKLPKFQMKHPNVDVKSEDVAVGGKIQLPTLEANLDESIEAGPMSIDNTSIDVDIPKVSTDLVSPVDLDVTVPDVKVEMPEKDGKKKGKFSFKSNFKMPKLHMGKGHAEAEVPIAEMNLPQLEMDSSSRGETDDDLEGENDKKKSSSKFGVGLKMPKLPKISGDVDVDTDVNVPSLNLEAKGDGKSDDSSDDEKHPEKKKSRGFAFKMPQLNVGGIKTEVDLPDVNKPQLTVKAPTMTEPNLEADLELKEGDLSKKSPFIVKMPALGPVGSSIDIDTPAVGLKRDSSSEDSSSDSDDDESKKFKLGFKMPKKSKNVQVDASSKISKPNVSLSSDADISLPEVSLPAKKKSSFGAKFQMRQRDADIELPQVELKTDESSEDDSSDKELKAVFKKPKFGIKLPEFNKPKANVEISKKDVELAANLPEVNIQPQKLSGNMSGDIDFPRGDVVVEPPVVDADISNVDIQVGNIDAEVAKVKAQLAQLQAEFDIQSAGKQQSKKEEDDSSSSSSESDNETKTKSSGLNFGLKLPKFKVGKEKPEMEPKVDVNMPTLSVTAKNNEDEMTSPSSLDVEPVKLESAHGIEKEKKKFSLGLKMPKFQSKGSSPGIEIEAGSGSKEVDLESKTVKVKAPKMKFKKKKGDQTRDQRPSSSSDSDSEDEHHDADDQHRNKEGGNSSHLMGAEVKLPRIQVYKNVEYHDAEKGHDSSSDEEDEVKDIKKNIGARFGVKLKKPKMFSSNKVEITGKNESSSGSSGLQPEWKLPRVDLRRASKSSDQELSVDVDFDSITEQQKLEQLSPSERAEAIRRDSKSSAGIRLHSPSYISLMPSPRSKKPSLETLDVESSPKLLSVTRLDPTPPIETSVTMQQPSYGNMSLTTTVTGPQVLASQVPSSVIMASDAVKLKRGPPTPARRSIVDPNSSVFYVAQPVFTTDVTVEGVAPRVGTDDATTELEIKMAQPIFTSTSNQQASDTDISITTSTGSDTLVISCVSPSSSASGQEAPNRKASSLGDLTRIPTSGSEDGSLERTVSLDFKPVSTLTGSSSRAIYNLAVQDLSRVGEDSDEDYNLNRKRPTSDDEITTEGEVTIITTGNDTEGSISTGLSGNNRTLLTINTSDDNGSDVNFRPLGGDTAEALWFGSTSIQTVESVQTTMSYTQMEESISTDVTLTTTSLGSSPSETSSSSSSSSSSEGSPFSPASPEPEENTPNLIEHESQVENGRTQQFHIEMSELTQAEMEMSGTRTISLEMTSPLSDDTQPQPLTDLNPSAGNFAAVRNRFEQLSGSPPINGAENSGSLGRSSGRTNQTQGSVIKRLSGNFEDLPPSSVNVIQKSIMQHIAPELSEGALSRTVIISSLALERGDQNNVSPTTGIGPESPVPNLEPPC